MNQENSLINGIIIKGIGGFYYVEASGIIYECKAKGVFRKKHVSPMVGDLVSIKLGTEVEENIIAEILPRKNEFIRPPVANVEASVIISAMAEPEPIVQFIDKLIIMAEKNNTEVIIVFNKCDLISDNRKEEMKEIYKNTGYPIVFVSTYTGEGIDELKELMKNKCCMFAGASGVGKSSIANAIENFSMETGGISFKTKRGKHTTRHAELLTNNEGIMIFDTPGFTSFDIMDIKADELKFYYPEFEEITEECKFKNSCVHVAEPECGVKKAVDTGIISQKRYDSYVRIYAELKEKTQKY